MDVVVIGLKNLNKIMIIVKIFGGLGNQMFQYAAGLALARKHNTSFGLDLSFFENSGPAITRTFGLDVFSISSNESTKKYKVNGFIKQLQRVLPWYRRSYIQEPHFEYTPDFFKIGKNALLDGYWQSEKYFADVLDDVRNEFTLKVDVSNSAKQVEE